MKTKELKRLRKSDLLKLLVEHMEVNAELEKKLAETSSQLQDRKIHLRESGSIAEAALQINRVFEAADHAVRQFVENAARVCQEQELAGQQTILSAQEQARMITQEAQQEVQKLLSEAQKECEEKRRQADTYWYRVTKQADDFRRILDEADENLLKRTEDNDEKGTELPDAHFGTS